MIECRGTGLVHSRPDGAGGAWFPSIVRLKDNVLLASFDIGEATESSDLRTHLSRSSDGGRTWTSPEPLFDDPERGTSHSVRLGRTADGTLVAMGARRYHLHPEGVLNRANLGYTQMDVIQLRSADEGRTWDGPDVVAAPLIGPSFETCHSVIELADGRWLYPTATWRDWAGYAPNGTKAVAFVSHDRGRTWSEYLDVMDGAADGIIYWEQSLVQLPDGRLLAVCWAFEESSGASLPNRFAVSEDGRAFGPPRPTGILGQTAKILALVAGRILCLYRRTDRPGLWCALADVESGGWTLLDHAPLWRGEVSGVAASGTNSDLLAALKFGYPCMIRMSGDEILALFWCHENGAANVRWIRLGGGTTSDPLPVN